MTEAVASQSIRNSLRKADEFAQLAHDCQLALMRLNGMSTYDRSKISQLIRHLATAIRIERLGDAQPELLRAAAGGQSMFEGGRIISYVRMVEGLSGCDAVVRLSGVIAQLVRFKREDYIDPAAAREIRELLDHLIESVAHH